ncbi:hypothetical protein AWC38_SpisGene1210 [Stylophora pistillata]|uniref:Myb/SANT-like DNA-binding domain-containing protein n=1 Tax=Stylophora pistillata TaxID=50429 RepID=A0A2B4T050_STYPI|nr:hypothetical protein AWC38_SpisGene1210 [Stylophora pistillata]
MASVSSLYQCAACMFSSATMADMLNHQCHIPTSQESEDIVGEDICGLALMQAEETVTPEVVSPDNVSAESQKLLVRWEDRRVSLLISSYSKFNHLLGKGKTTRTKNEVFAKISSELNSISEERVTADQCLRKWSKLEIKQKEIEDNNKQTGKPRESWKFHDDMSECMGSSPKMSLAFTFDTSSSSSSSTNQCDRDGDYHFEDHSDESGNDESGDENQKKKKKAKLPTRKRKSNSSAAEMLQFLHSYILVFIISLLLGNSFILTVRRGKKWRQRN